MKTILHLSLVIAFLTCLGPSQARADDEAVAAIGGFVAGIITGSIIDQHDGRHGRIHVYTDRHYGKDRFRDWNHRDWNHKSDWKGYKSHRSGHWEIRRVRVWVPGHWERVRNDCGDVVKVWQRGHYKWKKEKVWVSYRDRGNGFCYRD